MPSQPDHFPFDIPPPGEEIPRRYQGEIPLNIGLSLTRLVVGGILTGIDAMMDRLLTWEQRRIMPPESQANRNRGGLTVIRGDERFRIMKYEYSPALERTRHVLVGLIFIGQERLSRGLKQLTRLPQAAYERLQPVARPWTTGLLWRPIHYGIEQLSTRGAAEVERWATIGRREEENSRQLVDIAVTHTVDRSIHYLTLNQEVQELVKYQSTGLADEAIEELRERSVSADSFLEGLVRFVLRRRPRVEIPPPPEEVRAHAARLHPERWKDR